MAAPRAQPTRAGRVFFAVTAALALGVGALQTFRIHGGWLTNYGADVFGTAWLHAMTRTGKTVVQRGRALGAWSAAAVVFFGCALSEFGQKFHLIPGRFDVYDLLAFAGAVLACVAIERWTAPFVGDGV